MRPEIARLQADMRGFDYVAEPSIVTALHLARAMEKPLLVEGDAGVGKTEIAKVMAGVLGTELIRLQCYEGLDVNTALYEWNYQKQLLRLQDRGGGGTRRRPRRPHLRTRLSPGTPVAPRDHHARPGAGPPH